ncbi:hypothetical protein AGR7A_pAt30010 [Agrobacterium deltaense NCPPB 1641]|uniref:Uncharacterized protein n=1 Tax=Agrobacterium deltaense NCPPB 1641 TaxID=1183425 RepID=A0A1S7UAN1_9HYPH|nr:hypothetical protein AGR7A_pAt30010 [Agrobacterium deltaense NCPPB 1641]
MPSVVSQTILRRSGIQIHPVPTEARTSDFGFATPFPILHGYQKFNRGNTVSRLTCTVTYATK